MKYRQISFNGKGSAPFWLASLILSFPYWERKETKGFFGDTEEPYYEVEVKGVNPKPEEGCRIEYFLRYGGGEDWFFHLRTWGVSLPKEVVNKAKRESRQVAAVVV